MMFVQFYQHFLHFVLYSIYLLILFGLLMLVVCYSIKSDFNKQKIVKDGLERKNSRLQHEIELLRQNEDVTGDLRQRIATLQKELEEAVKAQVMVAAEADSQNKAVEEERLQLEQEIEELEQEKQNTLAAIADLQRQYKAVEQNKPLGEQLKYTNANEEHLVELLNEIKLNYPALSQDLSKIEWSKVWLPKMQKMCKEVGADRRGIYCISWKHEGQIDKYYGQAQNIKDRWYTHAKKFIGVEPAGNELLYNCGATITELWWDVINQNEVVDNLNARESDYIPLGSLNRKGGNRSDRQQHINAAIGRYTAYS